MHLIKYSIIIPLFFVAVVQSIGQNNQHVLYGEHPSKSKSNSDTYRIYYDKNGDLYPDFNIDDEALAKAGNSLFDFCKANPSSFKELTFQYGLQQEEYSPKIYTILQDSILKRTIREINQKSTAFKTIHFLVHGFRKPFYPKNGSSSSRQFFSRLRAAVYQRNGNAKQHFFIEVYWDGTYDCCFSKNIFRNRRLFKLFKNQARKQAVNTGYQLRKVIKELDKDHLSMISHSLGARVLTACLFNGYTKKVPSEWNSIQTPSKARVDICLVAPAISKKPFNHYYDRSTDLDFQQSDNYKLSIIYNETDFVLKKKWKGWGPGPKRHGRTTLGCNHKNEAVKLQSLFEQKYNSSKINLYHATDVGKCHLMRCYTSTSHFQTFLSSLSDDD